MSAAKASPETVSGSPDETSGEAQPDMHAYSAAPKPREPTESERLDRAADEAIAACGGDTRSAIRALILANEYLEHELMLHTSKGYRRGYERGRGKTYPG